MIATCGTPPGAWGLDVPPDLNERISRLTAPLPPDAVLDGSAGAHEAVRVWRATRQHKDVADHLAWAVLLDAIRRLFASGPPHLHEALATHRMHLGRTVAEINLQLGSRLYHLAWAQAAKQPDDAVLRTLLQCCVDAQDRAEAQHARLPAFAMRGLAGMRGVARVVLARGEEAPVERLEAAVADLATAEGLGDTTAAHYASLAEAHLRLFRLIGDDHLASAESALARADAAGHRTRALGLARAETLARRAFEAIADGRTDAGASLFERASEACAAALDLHADSIGMPDDLVRARRGQWVFQRALLEPGGAARAELLTAAICDLRGSPLQGTSLPRALLARAEAGRASDDWTNVLSDAKEAQDYLESTGVGDAKLRERVERVLAEAIAWCAVDAGAAGEALAGVRRLLDMSDRQRVSLAALSHGLRAAAPRLGPRELEQLCARAAEVARRELDDPGLGAEARRFAASHGAGLLWSVAHVRDDVELVSLAYGLFRDGLAVSDAPPAIEMLSSAGACALRLAKLLSSGSQRAREEALDLLDDARRHLTAAVEGWEKHGQPPGPDPAVMWSTLGDACTRRYGLSHDPADASQALGALDRARALGGNAARIDDLLGQLHYRRGRIMRSASDLQAAMQFKRSVAGAGAASRENLSVCAAAELTLHELDGDASHLRAGAEYAARAADADATWPWPLLQLAAIAGRMEAHDAEGSAASPLELALAGRKKPLLQMAAERAVASTEFGEHVLGGRQSAYVLSDPHGLLAQSLVLKPTPRENAEREWREADALRALVASFGESGMRVPEPLAIVERRSASPVYVMRRANGRELSRLMADAQSADRERPIDEVRRALRFLALFHARTPSRVGELRPWPSTARRQAARDHGRSLLMLGADDEAARRAREAFRAAADQTVPMLIKKDAHPQNWLVDDDGSVVMLDLEASTGRPALAEVVQLIDDYPLCDVSAAGFSERMELTDHYLDALRTYGVALDLPAPQRLYELFALQHAVFGLALLPSIARRTTSSIALPGIRAREAHFSQLCAWLSERAEDGAVRAAAHAAIVAIGLSGAIDSSRPSAADPG